MAPKNTIPDFESADYDEADAIGRGPGYGGIDSYDDSLNFGDAIDFAHAVARAEEAEEDLFGITAERDFLARELARRDFDAAQTEVRRSRLSLKNALQRNLKLKDEAAYVITDELVAMFRVCTDRDAKLARLNELGGNALASDWFPNRAAPPPPEPPIRFSYK